MKEDEKEVETLTSPRLNSDEQKEEKKTIEVLSGNMVAHRLHNLRPRWEVDEEVNNCFVCERSFTMIRRKVSCTQKKNNVTKSN